MKHETLKQFEVLNEPETVRILKNARARIEQGWCQRLASVNRNGQLSMCASTAIVYASQDFSAMHDYNARELLVRAIGGKAIPNWNDAKGRTKDEVLAAFDRAISLARIMESGI